MKRRGFLATVLAVITVPFVKMAPTPMAQVRLSGRHVDIAVPLLRVGETFTIRMPQRWMENETKAYTITVIV